MGIYADEKLHKRIIQFVAQRCLKLVFLLYVGSFVVLHFGIHNADKNFLDENSMVTANVYESVISQDYRDLYSTFDSYLMQLQQAESLNSIVSIMERIGLETTAQEFKVIYTLGYGRKLPATSQGTNLVGVHRAPRTAGTEALLLVIPYDSKYFHAKSVSSTPVTKVQLAGPALGLTLMERLRVHPWSKNLILLLADQQKKGTEAFMQGYHHDFRSHALHTTYTGRFFGDILAGLELDINGLAFTHLDLSINNVNGSLPNMDSVYAIIEFSQRLNIPLRLYSDAFEFDSRKNIYQDLSMVQQIWDDVYQQKSVTKLARAMLAQATGAPSSSAGLFARYNINGAGLKGAASASRREKSNANLVGYEDIAKLIESTLRAYNNLEEPFHHSIYYYLMLDGKYFLSIKIYMIALGLVVGCLVCLALPQWYMSGDWIHSEQAQAQALAAQTQKKKTSVGDNEELLTPKETILKQLPPFEGFGFSRRPRVWKTPAACTLASFTLAVVNTQAPRVIAEASERHNVDFVFSLLLFFVGTSCLVIILILDFLAYPFEAAASSASRLRTHGTAELEKLGLHTPAPEKAHVTFGLFQLVLTATVLIPLGLLNFSCGFFLGLVLVPLFAISHTTVNAATAATKANTYVGFFVKLVILMAASPITVLYALAFVYHLPVHLFLYDALQNYELLKVVTFPAVSFLYWTAWTTSISIHLHTYLHSESPPTHQEAQ